MSKLFKFLIGDVDYVEHGGKWYRRTGATAFHIIELMKWEEVCGERGPGDTTYNVSLSEVDISDTERLKDALSGYGWEEEGELPELAKVEAMHGHGAKAPLEEYNGNAWRKLMQEARADSREIMSSDEKYEEAMSKPVNKIGSTAREYQHGDMLSGVLRGVAEGNAEAELMLKMGVR